MKHIRTLLSFVVFIVLILTIAGCGSYLRLEEETIYQQKIDAFLTRLIKGILMKSNRCFHVRF